MKPRAVKGYDPGGFLAAVLQGVQPKCCDRGGFGMPENAEHAALLAQRVAVQIVVGEIELLAGDAWIGVIQAQVVLRGGVIIGRALCAVHRASLLV